MIRHNKPRVTGEVDRVVKEVKRRVRKVVRCQYQVWNPWGQIGDVPETWLET
jgi:hypothetical protein